MSHDSRSAKYLVQKYFLGREVDYRFRRPCSGHPWGVGRPLPRRSRSLTRTRRRFDGRCPSRAEEACGGGSALVPGGRACLGPALTASRRWIARRGRRRGPGTTRGAARMCAAALTPLRRYGRAAPPGRPAARRPGSRCQPRRRRAPRARRAREPIAWRERPRLTSTGGRRAAWRAPPRGGRLLLRVTRVAPTRSSSSKRRACALLEVHPRTRSETRRATGVRGQPIGQAKGYAVLMLRAPETIRAEAFAPAPLSCATRRRGAYP
jgi:hypothetical protein